MDYVVRFVVGAVVVSVFAVIGDIVRPRGLAGMFAAAPTIALATLGLTFSHEGACIATVEGRSMILGAVALGLYTLLSAYFLLSRNWSSLPAALVALIAWFAASFTLLALLAGVGIS